MVSAPSSRGGGGLASYVVEAFLYAFRTSFGYAIGFVLNLAFSIPVLVLSWIDRQGKEARKYKEAESFFEHVTIRTNGVDLHGLRHKKKEKSSATKKSKLALLLHGFPETSWSYRYQLKHLGEEGYDTVALDLRGMGESGGSTRGHEYCADSLVKDIVGVVHSLGYEKCFLVGHDIGGILAWCVAKASASVVERLVILNAPHPYVYYRNLSLGQFLKSYYCLMFLYPVFPEKLLALNGYEFVEKGMRLVNKQNLGDDDMDILKVNLYEKGTFALTCMLNYYRSFVFPLLFQQQCPQLSTHEQIESHPLTATSEEEIHQKFPQEDSKEEGRRPVLDWSMPMADDVPTLVLWGLQDSFLDHRVCLAPTTLHQVVPNLEVVKLESCSHWSNQDQPERVSQEILKHIRAEF